MGTLKPQEADHHSNTVLGTLAIVGWAVTFGTDQSPPRCAKCNSPPINVQSSVPTSYHSIWQLPLHYKGLAGLLLAMTITGFRCGTATL